MPARKAPKSTEVPAYAAIEMNADSTTITSIMLDKWSNLAKWCSESPEQGIEEPFHENWSKDCHRGGSNDGTSNQSFGIDVTSAGYLAQVVDNAAHD